MNGKPLCILNFLFKSSAKFLVLFFLFFGLTQCAWSRWVDFSVGEFGYTFLLDDKGDVWGFTETTRLKGLHKLKGLKDIKALQPFVAIDKNGDVFTWEFDREKTNYGEVSTDDIGIPGAVYTNAKRESRIKNAVLIAATLYNSRVVVQADGGIYQFGYYYEPKDGANDKDTVERRDFFRLIGRKPDIQSIAYSDDRTSVLLKNGDVISWLSTFNWDFQRGESTYRESLASIELGKVAAQAVSIHDGQLNQDQLSVLLADGRVAYLKSCVQFRRKDEQTYTKSVSTYGWQIMRDKHGVIGNIARMMGGSTNGSETVFVKRDGSVWSTNARKSEHINQFDVLLKKNPLDCGYSLPFVFQRVKGMSARARKVETGHGFVLALDSENQLWAASTANKNWRESFTKLSSPKNLSIKE
jgi:hypothetical protein